MKIFRFLIGSLIALSLSACATTMDKINDLVDDSVEHADELTEEEWALRDQMLEEFLKEYNANPESLTPEEKESLDRALGRYYGAQVKQGIDITTRQLEQFFNRLPNLIDGFFEGMGIELPETDPNSDSNSGSDGSESGSATPSGTSL